MGDWFEETRKWVDAVIKVAAAESDDNRQQLQIWTQHWSERAAGALLPVAEIALGDDASAARDAVVTALRERVRKAAGLVI